MNVGFGQSFRAARSNWQYQIGGYQIWWMALLLAFGGFAILSILQVVAGIIALSVHVMVDPSMLEQAKNLDLTNKDVVQRFSLKDMIIGIGPAAIASAFAVWGLAGIDRKNRWESLNLRRIDLGLLGWIVVVGGFIIAMFAVNVLVVYITQFDTKQIGLVEQAMADLRLQPMLYALTMPGIMVFTPIVEELIFRGAVFHALLPTRLGWSGTVLLSSALWAVVHGATAPWTFVFILFLMGIALGVLLLRFGSLWVTIACHAAWNLMTAVIIFYAPSLQ